MDNNLNIDMVNETNNKEKKHWGKFFSKKMLVVFCLLLFVFIVAALVAVSPTKEQLKYERAVMLIEKKKYEEAYLLFKELGEYRDSISYLNDFKVCYDKEEIWVHDGGNRITEYNFDEKRQWISKIEKNAKSGEIRSSFEYTYDSNGNLTSEKWTNPWKEVRIREYEYDKYGNVILSKSTESDVVFRYEYDKKGNRIRVIRDNIVTTEYEYDNKNRVIKETSFNEAGAVGLTRKYGYDKNGNKISNELLEADGQRRFLTEYKYNGGGKVVWSKTTNKNGDLNELVKCTYDGKYNLLTRKKEKPEEIIVEENRYDKNGNMLLHRLSVLDTSLLVDDDEEFVLHNEVKRSYDKNGNCLFEYNMDYDENYGISESTRNYFYDDKGNIVRTESSSGWCNYAYYGEKHIIHKEDHSWYKSY
ncbi:MAG: hypothetical protein IJD37_04200 [Clostridia bacterium]|nr:hypothetical protein [Clostridia bacterium]